MPPKYFSTIARAARVCYNGRMNEIWNAIVAWAGSVQLVNMLIVIVVGVIAYKFSGALIGWLINTVARGVHSKESHGERKKRLKTLSELFATVAKIIVVLTVVFTVLADLHVNLMPLFATAGVAGVALGFGAQNIIKDALAGFFIILENQYRVGDFIDISGVGIPNESGGGTVERLSIRSTTLRDRNGNVHIIPNGAIVQVVNKTLGFSKVHFTFAVATGTDTESLMKLVNETGEEMAGEAKWKDSIVSPPHFSEVGKIGKDGFNVTVSGTTEPAAQWDVSSEFRRRLIIKMRKRNIETIETIG